MSELYVIKDKYNNTFIRGLSIVSDLSDSDFYEHVEHADYELNELKKSEHNWYRDFEVYKIEYKLIK